MRTLTKLLAASAGALALAAASAGHAASVSIWVDDDGALGPDTLNLVAVGTNAASFSGSLGGFNINSLGGSVGLSPVTDTQALDTVSTGPGGDLIIFVSAQGLTAPLGDMNWLSTFTTQPLSAGWTLTETTRLSTSNQLFVGTLLGSAAFGGSTLPQLDFDFAHLNTGAGPYAINTQYVIHAAGPGSANSTIDVFASVPEPSTWALMIMGFGGAGAMLRNRRRLAVAA